MSDYTHQMTNRPPTDLVSRELRIRPDTGQVFFADGEPVRLGPVNMKVLQVLLRRAGAVVSRGDIYTEVWANQVVGEDALTRCISDIRAELRNLSGRDDWIETLPKRGYRWTQAVSEASSAAEGGDHAAVERVGAAAETPESVGGFSRTSSSGHRAWSRPVLRLAVRGAAYALALLLLASVFVWSIERFAGSSESIVAVIPVSSTVADAELAARLDVEIAQFLSGLADVRRLSPSAIEARPVNPFPFFSYEFGARWLLEGELRTMSGHTSLTVTVADARTGIVELQMTADLSEQRSGTSLIAPSDLAVLTRFFGSEISR